jgi:AraC family transcriptional regulator
MSKSPALKDRDTRTRLRRALDSTEGRRAIATMARDACFSARQFHRLTVEEFGEPPGAHQRRVRLDRSAWLLLTSRTTILAIALETGWESHESFTRAFRARFGVSPSSFRAGERKLPRAMQTGFAFALHTTHAYEQA